jgi:ABC-2 type transport system ATP-binding protein
MLTNWWRRSGLTGHANKEIRRLSGGQRRRLDVAVGVVGRPELLFLDEPTAGLDPAARREFHDLVLRLAGEGETTILLTTHDLDEAEKLADRILILNGGRIVADGTAEELARQIAGEDEVRWTRDGQRFVLSTTESTRFVFDLFRQHGEAIADLEVRRASLEDTYLALVRQAEAGEAAARKLEGVA